MSNLRFTTRIPVLFSIVVLGITASPVHAYDSRIRALEARIQALESQLAEQADTIAKEQEARKEADKGNIVVKHNERSISFESTDGSFKFKPRGRLHTDLAFHDNDIQRLGDGAKFRRARLGFEGTVFNVFDYLFEYDFAASGVGGIRDAYLKYTGFDQAGITVGNFKHPFSLEQLISSNNGTFIERPLVDALVPGRAIGLGVDTSGKQWTAALGAFGAAPGDYASGVDNRWDVTGRLTFAPINESGRVLHFGGAGRYGITAHPDKTLRFRSRPEAAVTDVRLIDTGTITDINDSLGYGFEAAGVYGPLSLQGEYIGTHVHRKNDSNLRFDGWYVAGSWFLTGESRPYRDGVFGRISPKSVVGKGGHGAWELALRYSALNLSDRDIIGGEQRNFTAGINWYLTSNVRLQANYIHVLDVDRPGNIADGDEPGIFLTRASIDF